MLDHQSTRPRSNSVSSRSHRSHPSSSSSSQALPAASLTIPSQLFLVHPTQDIPRPASPRRTSTASDTTPLKSGWGPLAGLRRRKSTSARKPKSSRISPSPSNAIVKAASPPSQDTPLSSILSRGATANNPQFSTADRTILEELQRTILARESQFISKGAGTYGVNGLGRGINGGAKKHHAYSPRNAPYPRSYEREVVDLDVWETLFCQNLCGAPTWHTFDKPPAKVLDIGCGTGYWILECARTWKNTHFVGLDIVPLHPDLQQVGLFDLAARITWVQENFLDRLPFPNEEFDFVHIKRIARGVPEDKWDSLLEEIARVMKPGAAFEMIEDDLDFPGKSLDSNSDHGPFSSGSDSDSEQCTSESKSTTFEHRHTSRPKSRPKHGSQSGSEEYYTDTDLDFWELEQSSDDDGYDSAHGYGYRYGYSKRRKSDENSNIKGTQSQPIPSSNARMEPDTSCIVCEDSEASKEERDMKISEPDTNSLAASHLHSSSPPPLSSSSHATRSTSTIFPSTPSSVSLKHPHIHVERPPVSAPDSVPSFGVDDATTVSESTSGMLTIPEFDKDDEPPARTQSPSLDSSQSNDQWTSNLLMSLPPRPSAPEPQLPSSRDHVPMHKSPRESVVKREPVAVPPNPRPSQSILSKAAVHTQPTSDRKQQSTKAQAHLPLKVSPSPPITSSRSLPPHPTPVVRKLHSLLPNRSNPSRSRPLLFRSISNSQAEAQYSSASLSLSSTSLTSPSRTSLALPTVPLTPPSNKFSNYFNDNHSRRGSVIPDVPEPYQPARPQSQAKDQQLTEELPSISITAASRGTPSLLRTPAKPPRNPRDHTLLKTIYTEMHAARFINLAPLSLLGNSLGLYFKDVRTHPPLVILFPPLPPKRQKQRQRSRTAVRFPDLGSDSGSDDLAELPSSGGRNPTSSAPNWAGSQANELQRQLLVQKGEVVGDQENAQASPRFVSIAGLLSGASPYASLDISRMSTSLPSSRASITPQAPLLPAVASAAGPSLASANSDSATPTRLFTAEEAAQRASISPMVQSNPFSEFEFRLPNRRMEFDLHTLNLHLAMRSLEVIACAESMWEWVQAYQRKELEREEQGTGTIRAGMSQANAEIVGLTRLEFDTLLSSFDFDMRDHMTLGHALEDRLGWKVMLSPNTPERKLFDTDCKKWAQYEREQRERQRQQRQLERRPYRYQGRMAERADSSTSLGAERSMHGERGSDVLRTVSRRANLVSGRGSIKNRSEGAWTRHHRSPTEANLSAREDQERASLTSVRTHATSERRVCRTFRVFVAWKA